MTSRASSAQEDRAGFLARFLPFCRETWKSLSKADLDKNDAHVVVQKGSAFSHLRLIVTPTSWVAGLQPVTRELQLLTSPKSKHILRTSSDCPSRHPCSRITPDTLILLVLQEYDFPEDFVTYERIAHEAGYKSVDNLTVDSSELMAAIALRA